MVHYRIRGYYGHSKSDGYVNRTGYKTKGDANKDLYAPTWKNTGVVKRLN